MVRRLIGSDTTGTDGSVSIPYTGTGAGLVNLEVETTIDGTLVSETYELLDCIKYDKGTGSSHNDIWTAYGVTLSRGADYSTLTESTTGTDGLLVTQIDHSCLMEFDVQIVSTDYTKSYWQIGQSAQYATRGENHLLMRDGNWHHCKIIIQGSNITLKEDSNTYSFKLNNYDSSMDMYFRFKTISDITGINFKNFKYYPIPTSETQDPTLFFDKAISSDYNDFYTDASILSSYITRYDSYSSLTEPSSSNVVIRPDLTVTGSTCFEIDVKVVDGAYTNPILDAMDSTDQTVINGFNANLLGISDRNWHHIRIEAIENETKLYAYVDEDTTPIYSPNRNIGNSYRYGLRTGGDITELDFKNLKIYSI